MKNQLIQDLLIKKYIYDEFSGLLFHRRPDSKKLTKEPIGSTSSHGYLVVNIGEKIEYVHRIVWIMTEREIPKGMVIDHIDRDKKNNKKENLRLTSSVVNRNNSKKRITNKSGVVGVHWGRHVNKWVAQFQPPKKKAIHLGCFDSIEEATEARKKAEGLYFKLDGCNIMV